MNNENNLVIPQNTALQTADPTPLDLIARMLDSGKLTPDSVAIAEKLIALQEHMEDRQAEKEFADAFKRLQSGLKTFKASKVVPDKQGNKRYSFLPYEEIMEVVRPLCDSFGFSISYSTTIQDNRIVQTCTLQHEGGHHRDYTAFVRVGSGPYGATETQADGAAMTYAKRYALCNALNITVEHDTDARTEGQPITQDQADTLCQMVRDSGSNEEIFLRFAGAKTYSEIGSNRYSDLFEKLKEKMRKAGKL